MVICMQLLGALKATVTSPHVTGSTCPYGFFYTLPSCANPLCGGKDLCVSMVGGWSKWHWKGLHLGGLGLLPQSTDLKAGGTREGSFECSPNSAGPHPKLVCLTLECCHLCQLNSFVPYQRKKFRFFFGLGPEDQGSWLSGLSWKKICI